MTRPGLAAAVALAIGTAFAVGASGCSEPCCVTDGYPIGLMRAPGDMAGGGLRALAANPADRANVFTMAVDTGAGLTYVRRTVEPPRRMVQRSFEILDALGVVGGDGTTRYPVRARLKDIDVLPVDMPVEGSTPGSAGADLGASLGAILGGALLHNYSVELRFFGAAPAMTLWSHQEASDDSLGRSGYAVLQFDIAGGVELDAVGRPDFIGLTGPVQVPATRIVLRGCAGHREYQHDDSEPLELCCNRDDEVRRATGADLALMVATGVGPLVLSQSAWNRVTGAIAAAAAAGVPGATLPPEPTAGPPLVLPTVTEPVAGALWSELPRLALVDQEIDDANNPGACIELARAQRMEWLVRHQADATPPCAQLCDRSPRDASKVQNAAAHIDLGGGVPVAVVPDGAEFLQSLRAEIRPEAPEIDGLLGAAVLQRASMEIDYGGKPKSRAVMSCDPDAGAQQCWIRPRRGFIPAPNCATSCG